MCVCVCVCVHINMQHLLGIFSTIIFMFFLPEASHHIHAYRCVRVCVIQFKCSAVEKEKDKNEG